MASPLPLYLAGPTGAGKSAAALLLAERVNGEIISVDSMQVYRGMDIGTAKPSLADRERVRHHLIDIRAVGESFDAAEFVRLAEAARAEVLARDRIPIFCGGTGLYFQALTQGLGEAPAPDERLRTILRATPLPELVQELQRSDPATFESIDRSNLRRVLRAVEVLRLTGKPLSAQLSRWGRGRRASAGSIETNHPRIFVLRREKLDLNQRIEQRVDLMFASGLVEEVRERLHEGLAENKIAMQALGYRQVVEYLNGVRSLHDTIALVKQRTRKYAKRQLTWFRRQPGCTWIDVAPDQTNLSIAETVARLWGDGGHSALPTPELRPVS